MAAYEEKSDLNKEWPCDPMHYQWKGTITAQNGKWHVLCHCKPRKEDVLLKIKSSKDDSDTDVEDIETFSEITRKLMNIQHPNLMTPVYTFSCKSEIYAVYPRHSGGPISEVLASHYPNGIENEEIVASILYDTALGLQNLHKQQCCHRNIRASSLHIDIDQGKTLLSDFKSLKDIKWKYARGRRNTRVSPEREPFTDPLFLLDMDEDATWYTNDIYAFGITALQLTYGSTPSISTKNVLNRSYSISTDLYEKKCPFSKSFESLIKECCGPLNARISINKLVEHKFFKKDNDCPNPVAIQNFFGHILKSTEKRINNSLEPPPSLKPPDIDIDGNENIDDSNTGPLANGITISGPTTNADASQTGDNSNLPLDDHFSWSTRIDSSMLEAATSTIPQTIQENEVAYHRPSDAQTALNGPTIHKAISVTTQNSVSYNDPTNTHHLTPKGSPHYTNHMGHGMDEFQPTDELMQSNRNYRFSFSQSESGSHPVMSPTDTVLETQLTGSQDQSTPVPKKIGRFKVAAGRLSVSGDSQEKLDELMMDPQDSGDEHAGGNTGNVTKPKGRFMVSPAAPEQEHSASEEADGKSDLSSPGFEDNSQPEPSAQQKNVGAVPNGQISPPEEWIAPDAEKSTWTAEQCSQWVTSLGAAYQYVGQLFIDNAIDGDILSDEQDPKNLEDMLKDIVTTKAHAKRIAKSWTKLQT